jgi:hypothetical protein
MEEVLVAPSEVLPPTRWRRVPVGAGEDVVICVPGQVPVPYEWVEAMPGTKLVVFYHDLLQGFWWGGAWGL